MSTDLNTEVLNADCLAALRDMPDASVDAVVTDPPYGLSNTRPEQVAETITRWVSGDREYLPSRPRKGRKNCLTQILRRSEGDVFDAQSEAGGDLVNLSVSLDPVLTAMLRSVNLDDEAAFREEEVNDVSAGLALDDVLVNDLLTNLGEGCQDVQLRLRAGKGSTGCVGECACFAELSDSRVSVGVRLGYYALTQPEGAAPVVTLRTTEVGAMLAFDVRRGTLELTPATAALHEDAPTLLLSPKGVGAGSGAGGLAPMTKPGGVGGVGVAADGAIALDLLAHADLLDRFSRPNDTPVGFMGHEWDAFVPPVAVWDECLRVLKPGGHLLAFAGSRTHDLMTLGIRLAGFEIRDSVAWLYGSGFPKSMDVSKAIDKRRDWTLVERLSGEIRRARAEAGLSLAEIGQATLAATDGTYGKWYHRGGHMFFETGRSLPSRPEWEHLRHILPVAPEFAEVYDEAEREVLRETTTNRAGGSWAEQVASGMFQTGERTIRETAPATDAAREWEGWGTALKPAFEPVTLARKPLEGTVAANVMEHGTGALNVDGCRIAGDMSTGTWGAVQSSSIGYGGGTGGRAFATVKNPAGRWPANVVLDESQAEALDRQTGYQRDGVAVRHRGVKGGEIGPSGAKPAGTPDMGYGGGGGASRFFYVAKAPKSERPVVDGVAHSTVKPVTLMRWMVRMVTPPGGTVLDPFAGSGTTLEAATLEGFDSIGIEREADYLPLIHHRIERATTTRKVTEDEAAGCLFDLEGDSA